MTKPARLFDCGIDRSISHEHWRGASRFDSLNRSDMPAMQTARAELERWYSRFCDSDGDLRARFRCPKNDANHDGAFFELFLHELFSRLGLCVDVYPKLETGGVPDFLVTGSGGRAFVEATYLKQSSTTPPLEARVLNEIDDLIERVPAEIGLNVWVAGTLHTEPSLRGIKRKVCRWLNELAPRIEDWRNVPEKQILIDPKHGDLVLTLQVVPRATASRVIQTWSSSDFSSNFGDAIRRAVSKKAERYKDLRLPLVVAVNISSARAEVDEEAALFGQQTLRIHGDSSSDPRTSAGVVRTGTALWFDNWKQSSRNPELSAVMMFHDLAPWTVANVSACLYLNPYVDDRLPRELRTLGYAAAVDGDLRRFKGGHSVRDVLGLSEDWPGSFGLGD